jgi:hypothetical protein
MKRKTYLPVFPGFYYSEFEADYYFELEHMNEIFNDIECAVLEEEFYSMEEYYDSNNRYELNVCQACTRVIERELKENGFIQKIIMERMISPREYNFHNDSIDIEVTLTKQNIKNIEKFINDHKEKFEEYLKAKYTSCSGFISFHDNYMSEEWEIKNAIDDSHKLGSILDFICSMLEIDSFILRELIEVYIEIDFDKLRLELYDKFSDKLNVEMNEEEKEKFDKVKNERELDNFPDQLKLF